MVSTRSGIRPARLWSATSTCAHPWLTASRLAARSLRTRTYLVPAANAATISTGTMMRTVFTDVLLFLQAIHRVDHRGDPS